MSTSSDLIPQFLDACRQNNQETIERLIQEVATTDKAAFEQGRDLVDDSLRLLFGVTDKIAPDYSPDKHFNDLARKAVQAQPYTEEDLKVHCNNGWRYVVYSANRTPQFSVDTFNKLYKKVEHIPASIEGYWMVATGQLEALKALADLPLDNPILLNTAVLCGQTAVVEYLLERGAKESNLLVALASRGNNSKAIFELLLKRGADLHLALHEACAKGDLEMVTALLDAKADPKEVRAADGKTPLDIARKNLHTPIIQVFLERNLVDETQVKSVVDYAIAVNETSLMRMIIKSLPIDWPETLTQAVLKSESRRDTSPIVQLLLEEKPEQFSTELKITLIEKLHDNPYAESILKLLLKEPRLYSRAQLRKWCQSSRAYQTPLFLSALREVIGISTASTLPANKGYNDIPTLAQTPEQRQAIYNEIVLPDAEKNNHHPHTPFYWAAYLGLKHELAAEHDPFMRPEELNAAFQAACINGHLGVIDYFTSGKEPISLEEGLLLACEHGQAHAALALIHHGANINFINPKTGLTVLMTVVTLLKKQNQLQKLYDALVENKAIDLNCLSTAIPNYKKSRLKTRLDDRFMMVHFLCCLGHDQLLASLLVAHPELSQALTELGYTPLAIALLYQQEPIIDRLLSLDDPDPSGIAFIAACESGNVKAIKALAARYPDRAPMTPLKLKPEDESQRAELDMLLAPSDQRHPIMKLPLIQVENASPAFEAACLRDDVVTAKRLMQQCPSLEDRINQFAKTACLGKNFQILEWIIANYKRSLDCNELLVTSVLKGLTDIIELLLKEGADIDYIGVLKTTPLMLALRNPDKNTLNVIKLILAYHPDFSLVDEHNNNAVDWVLSNLASDIIFQAVLIDPDFTQEERDQLLVLLSKAANKFNSANSDEKNSVKRKIELAVKRLLDAGVSNEARTEAIKLMENIPPLKAILQPQSVPQEPTAKPAEEKPAAQDPLNQPASPVVNASAQGSVGGGTSAGREDLEAVDIGPDYTPADAALNYAQGKLLGLLESISAKFSIDTSVRGKEKYRQLRLVTDRFNEAIHDNSRISLQELHQITVHDEVTGRDLTIDSALNYRRFFPSSKKNTKSYEKYKQVEMESAADMLKPAVIHFLQDQAKRLKRDHTGKRDELQKMATALENAQLQGLQPIAVLCRFKVNGEGKNLLQVLMTHRDSSKEGTREETKSFKQFQKQFHLSEHLSNQQIRDILAEGQQPGQDLEL